MTIKFIEGEGRVRLSIPSHDTSIGVDVFHPGNVGQRADAYSQVDGVALRDALLEAFPLEEKRATLTNLKPSSTPTPGTVLESGSGGRLVVVPEDQLYSFALGKVLGFANASHYAQRPDFTVVFDPRGAKALPSPLGIRVGDTVRRTRVSNEGQGRAVYTETVEFEVNHIDGATGRISPKQGAITYSPKGFEVTSREVPDRLPAGAIMRQHGRLYLRVEDGYIDLTDGEHFERSRALETDLGRGNGEVIYLP